MVRPGDMILVDGIKVGTVNVTCPSVQGVMIADQVGDDVEFTCSGGAVFTTSRNNTVFVF